MTADTPPNSQLLEYRPPPPRVPLRDLLVLFTCMAFANGALNVLLRNTGDAVASHLEFLKVSAFHARLLQKYLPIALSAIILPFLAYNSDRARSRWGRRMPFIALSLLPSCVFGALLGTVEELRQFLGVPAPNSDATWTVIATLGPALVAYDVSFIVFRNSFAWLVGDVVPHRFLGRYFAFSSVFGIVVGLLLFSPSLLHLSGLPIPTIPSPWLNLIAAGALLLSIILLFLFVRERPLPPPPDTLPHAPLHRRFLHGVRNFFVQSLVHPIYLCYYAFSAFSAFGAIAWGAGVYYMLHRREALSISLAHLGQIGVLSGVLSLLFVPPAGWIVDKIHPMRATLLGAAVGCAVSVVFFFVNSLELLLVVTAIQALFSVLRGSAEIPLQFRFFPVRQYAQFVCFNSGISFCGVTIGGIGAGLFMNSLTPLGTARYAYAHLWSAFFQLLALVFLYLTYRLWSKHGADDFHYEVDLAKANPLKTALPT